MRKIDNRAQCSTSSTQPTAVDGIIGKPKDLAMRHIRPEELTECVSYLFTSIFSLHTFFCVLCNLLTVFNSNPKYLLTYPNH